jgi:hypothetical protein
MRAVPARHWLPHVDPDVGRGTVGWPARAGSGWTLLVPMTAAMRSHPLWDTGVEINGVLHVLRLRID